MVKDETGKVNAKRFHKSARLDEHLKIRICWVGNLSANPLGTTKEEDAMIKRNGGWSPYLAGGLTGLLGVLSVWLTGKYYGASTSFVRTAGMIEELFGAERVAQMEYFIKNVPKVDWQWVFVAGILLGSMVSALTSGSFKWQAVPDMWSRRFGNTPVTRGVVAFIGGVVAMFGARLADG